MSDASPLVPDYGGACLSNIVPALLGPAAEPPSWFPPPVREARQVVLLVLDGLGWDQLMARRHLMPTVAALEGGPGHSVAPTTTATALTSITTGCPPGEHGIIGYRFTVHGEVLNVLRWATERGDARGAIPPAHTQRVPPFLGLRVPVVTRAEFAQSGFSGAHLAGMRHYGWRMASSLVAQVRALLRDGEPFVYAYYDGIDKVAHEFGLGEAYDLELRSADRLVADLLTELPDGAALFVTSDHGQVDVGDRIRTPDPGVLALARQQSGEGRFRWFHARPGAHADLLAAAREAHGHEAWAVSLEQMIDEHWFGPRLSPAAAGRLGDVALVARADVAFDDPADSGPYQLVARHGSLTAAEVRIPILAGRRS